MVLVSCTSPLDVAPGQNVDLQTSADFYFYRPSDPSHNVVNPAVQVAQLVLEGAYWVGPPTVSIANANLKISPTTVEWTEQNLEDQTETHSSAPGFTLSATAVVRFGADAQPGSTHIGLRLPNLKTVAEALNAVPTFPNAEYDDDRNTVWLETYTVEEPRNAVEKSN
jgi:hypothetical protein